MDKLRDEHIAHDNGRRYEAHANQRKAADADTTSGLAQGRIALATTHVSRE